MFLLLFFPRDQSRDVTPRLGGGRMNFHFPLFKSILCFLSIEIYYTFCISCIVLTGYVYFYCI